MNPIQTSQKAQPTRLTMIYGFEIFNFGLRYATQISESIEFLGEIEKIEEPVSNPILEKADIAVIQVDPSNQVGFDLCYHLGNQYTKLATLILANQDLDIYYVAAHAVNARGLMLFHQPVESMVEQIQQAVRGPIFTKPQLVRIYNWQSTIGAKLRVLSQREWEVFRLIAQGYKNREISEMLEVSKNTVERHMSNLMDKLGLRTRTTILNFYYNNQLNAFDLLVSDKKLRSRLFDPSKLEISNNAGKENSTEKTENGGNGKNAQEGENGQGDPQASRASG